MGELLGKQIMPREIAAALAVHFTSDVELVKGVATSLGESQGRLGAYNDNLDSRGRVLSRDCGFMQHNIPADQIGSAAEWSLRTESRDPAVYGPVVANGARLAHEKYHSPMKRGSKNDMRRWQPWVAYTSGWATFPEWWVWHQDAEHRPVGPWMATGRFVQKAIPGVVNFRFLAGMPLDAARELGVELRTTFGVEGVLAFDSGRRLFVWRNVPKRPVGAPADGVGPRPKPNKGL